MCDEVKQWLPGAVDKESRASSGSDGFKGTYTAKPQCFIHSKWMQLTLCKLVLHQADKGGKAIV